MNTYLIIYLIGIIPTMLIVGWLSDNWEEQLDVGCRMIGVASIWPALALFIVLASLTSLIGQLGLKLAALKHERYKQKLETKGCV